MFPGTDLRVARIEAELARVRAMFEQTFAGIPTERLHRAPAGRWTPAQILWHCAKVERGIARLLERLDAELPEMATVPPGPSPERVLHLIDHIPWKDRTQKRQAIPGIVPPDTVDVVAEKGRLADGRVQLLGAMQASGPRLSLLRYDHPLFGPFDGWQWALSVARHEERHIGQLTEVAASPL